jgi:tetratricopeptide (TPR) repeat protein
MNMHTARKYFPNAAPGSGLVMSMSYWHKSPSWSTRPAGLASTGEHEDPLIQSHSKRDSLQCGLSRSALTRVAVALAAVTMMTWLVAATGVAAPGDEAAYHSGLVALKAADHRKAIQLFSRAIEINPRDHRYYSDRGIAYRAAGDLDKALEDYSKALEIKPDYPNALNNRGLVYVQQGLFDKAIVDFNEALKHGGFQAKIHTNLGLAYASKGNHQEAIRHFEEATSYRPVDPRAFFFMAQAFEELGQSDKALKMYQVALGVIKDPGTEEVIEKKITHLEKSLLPVDPAGPKPAVAGAAPVAPGPKQATTAAAIAAAAKTLPDKRPSARREVVRAGQVPHAVINLEKTVQTAEENRPATLEELNRVHRSRALAKFSPNAAEIFRQGLQFMDQADTRKALIRFEDTLQLERRNKNLTAVAWSLLEAGRVYVKIGDHAKAWTNLEGALRVFRTLRAGDEIVITLVDMASVKKAAGQPDLATKLLSEAARDATTLGNRQLASALEDMAAGRTPRAPTKKPSQAAEAKQPAPGAALRDEPQPSATQPKQMPSSPAIPALGSRLSTVPQQKAGILQQSPAATARASSPPPPERVNQRIGIWGLQTKKEPTPEAAPSVGRGAAAEPPSQPVDRKGVAGSKPQPESAALTAPSMRREKPIGVETQVGGEPAPVARPAAPTGPPARALQQTQAHPESERKTEPKTVALREKPVLREKPKASAGSSLEEPTLRLNKAESSQKRINEDLAELKKYKQSGDETSMIVVLERLAKRYTLRTDNDRALHSLVASLALREKLGVHGGSAQIYLDRGALKERTGDRPGALEDMTRALSLMRKQGHEEVPGLEARCKALADQLGLESPVAMEAFSTLWAARAAGDGQGETDALYAIGRLYDRAHKSSEALNYYDRSSASVLTDKARMYEKMGKQKLAEQSYKEALDTFRKLDYSRYLNIVKQSGISAPAPKRPRR